MKITKNKQVEYFFYNNNVCALYKYSGHHAYFFKYNFLSKYFVLIGYNTKGYFFHLYLANSVIKIFCNFVTYIFGHL